MAKTKKNTFDLDRITTNLKSIIFIGGFFWTVAGFYYSTEYGKEAFMHEVQERKVDDDELYSRITKTTGRNADWNIKQDDRLDELLKEVEELKIENAYQKGLLEGLNK